MQTYSESEKLYSYARELMPGGVNSPVRAFKGVGGTPVYFKRGKGAYLYDEDGNRYIDFVCSWGAIIHGHADPGIHQAIINAAEHGTSFGAPHRGEIEIAELVLQRVSSIDQVRFVNSGTEAVLASIRLARAASGRTKLIKFEGNYHGAIDALLAKAGSGVATLSLPDSAGVPAAVTQGTLLAPYNSIEAVSKLLELNGQNVAAILVEPVAGNMGVVPPKPGFLSGLRQLCDQYGCFLIFDEVMTGFRVGGGGASEHYGVTPDIITMGKVIGGGLPVGAYGAKKALMDWVAPVGAMYQAGTLSGNPLAVAAGAEALRKLKPESYQYLEAVGAQLQSGLQTTLDSHGVPAQVQRVGSMISVYLTESTVCDYEDAQTTNRELYGRIFHSLLKQGIYLPPSSLESWFISLSHSEEDIHVTVDAFSNALDHCTDRALTGAS